MKRFRRSAWRSAVCCMASACAAAHPPALVTESPQPAVETPRTAASAYHARHQGGVDTSTGIYGRTDDDLVIPTRMPLVLTRTYNSGDRHPRSFGINTMDSGAWWLIGDSDPAVPWGDLISPEGWRLHFHRISAGSTQETAVLLHEGTPTEFNGALLRWNGLRWVMRLRNGSRLLFTDCHDDGESCLLVERQDAAGNRIEYRRDPSGRLLSMESEGQAIRLEYDDHKRIVAAADTVGHSMAYTYDLLGRLTRAEASDGTTWRYEYNDRHGLTLIVEPFRTIRNWYDESGRLSRQVTRWAGQEEPYIMTFEYVVRDGTVVESIMGDNDGTRTVTRYNHAHYKVSETFDADGPMPVTFAYDLDPISNVRRTATLTCGAGANARAWAVPASAGSDEDLQQSLIWWYCAPRRPAP